MTSEDHGMLKHDETTIFTAFVAFLLYLVMLVNVMYLFFMLKVTWLRSTEECL